MRFRLTTAALLGTALTLTACASDSEDSVGMAEEAIVCEDITLEDTGFTRYLEAGTIPTDLDSTVEDVRVRENHFDPCQQLSWLVIDGIAGGAPTLGVVFFHQGELVRDASVLHSEISEQTRLSESTVSIEYPAPENVYTVEHSWEQGGVALTGGDVAEFTSEILVGANLDLTTPPTE